uniref:Uncharacterized protein n=1 Tax=Rhizophora mucronata TaxID=61149 RepID=A0A2P2L284_RHIMU
MEKQQREHEDGKEEAIPAPIQVSALNCIDLSSADIRQSVSLLKQVS